VAGRSVGWSAGGDNVTMRDDVKIALRSAAARGRWSAGGWSAAGRLVGCWSAAGRLVGCWSAGRLLVGWLAAGRASGRLPAASWLAPMLRESAGKRVTECILLAVSVETGGKSASCDILASVSRRNATRPRLGPPTHPAATGRAGGLLLTLTFAQNSRFFFFFFFFFF
jgi:hypothetical protein